MKIQAGVFAGALAIALAGCTDSVNDTGFAGLAQQTAEVEQSRFQQPEPGDTLAFPEDWGPHPQHRIEWWYLTANLETQNGRPLGLQWTQFRQALKPRPANAKPPEASAWPLDAAWMAHAAVSFGGEHWFEEKLARGDVGHAGAISDPLQVWLDDWRLVSKPDSGNWYLQVEGGDWRYNLRLSNIGKPVPHGQNGFSAKSASGEGSMYFSLVDLRIEGTVTLGDETLAVSGKGWFDREWSSQFLKAGQQGWDWFALHLDDGHKLMAFRLREDQGAFVSGSWINANGQVEALNGNDISLSPLDWQSSPQGRVPVEWHLRMPQQNVDIQVAAPPGDYWNAGLYPYWESPVTVTGSHDGVGYMELTGYRN